MLLNSVSKAWPWKKRATLKRQAGYFFRPGTNQRTTLKKFTAANYVARHQKNVSDQLKWLETALHSALNVNDDAVKGAFPSLYSNIAKCYEELGDLDNAKKK